MVGQAVYSLTSGNELEMLFEAEVAGKPSPVALTNHAYWNLSGGLKRKVSAGHTLRVQADKYLVLGEHMVREGGRRPTARPERPSAGKQAGRLAGRHVMASCSPLGCLLCPARSLPASSGLWSRRPSTSGTRWRSETASRR